MSQRITPEAIIEREYVCLMARRAEYDGGTTVSLAKLEDLQ
jgi:hypothetical protein